MVISEVGAAIITYNMDFDDWCKKNDIRNPFNVSYALGAKRIYEVKNGWYIREATEEEEALEPSQEEKDAFIEAREIYIAARLFYDFGYDEFAARVKMNHLDWLLEDKNFTPCLDISGQCRMDCPFFGFGKCYINGCANGTHFIFFPKMKVGLDISKEL